MSDQIQLALPPEAVEAIVEAVTERVLDRLAAERDNGSPWLAGAKAAAEYLGWTTKDEKTGQRVPTEQRVYKRLHGLPHYREGSRLMFLRAELDAYLEQHREGHR
jgi:hypothetical protein